MNCNISFMEINISSLKKVISKHAENQNDKDGTHHISFKIIAKCYLALMYYKEVSFYQKREKIRTNWCKDYF
jgi:hypothetical protein